MIKLTTFFIALMSAALAQELLPKPFLLREDGAQSDFPALALDSNGTPWVAYVAWDSKQDTLRLAKVSGEEFSKTVTIGKPGIIHQPTLAVDGSDAIVVVWQ